MLLTVLYADLFDYALRRDELFGRLVTRASEGDRVEAAADRLCGRYLSAVDDFVVWKGREHLVAIRRRRQEASPRLWAAARRYGRWLARIPFVRMVAVSGSLAVDNAGPESDIDLFCITAADRLWLARLFIVPLSKLTRRFPLYLCPNYILAMDALEVAERNLFTAHEVVQAVPIWGAEVFQRFLDANRWVSGFLPHRPRTAPAEGAACAGRPVLKRAAESLVPGRLGDALNHIVHRLFLSFYRCRAERTGWSWASLAPAYGRDRYTIPEGGYVRVVHRLFEERVRERLGDTVSATEVAALFPDSAGDGSACYDWEAIFQRDYGPARTRLPDAVDVL